MISNCIPYKGVPYIRGLTVIWIIMIMLHNNTSVNVTHWYLGDLDVVLKMQFSIFYYLLVFSVLVIMPSYECHSHRTLLVTTIESLTARMCKILGKCNQGQNTLCQARWLGGPKSLEWGVVQKTPHRGAGVKGDWSGINSLFLETLKYILAILILDAAWLSIITDGGFLLLLFSNTAPNHLNSL